MTFFDIAQFIFKNFAKFLVRSMHLGCIQKLRGQDEGQKMSVFFPAHDIKTVHAGGEGGQKMAEFCQRSC